MKPLLLFTLLSIIGLLSAKAVVVDSRSSRGSGLGGGDGKNQSRRAVVPITSEQYPAGAAMPPSVAGVATPLPAAHSAADSAEPYFDTSMPRNVSGQLGKSAFLGCRVRNLENRTVSWVRHRDIHILTVGSYTYTSDQRFQAFYSGGSEWVLVIRWVQERDAGIYECQISTQPVRSYYVNLRIVSPSAKILGGTDMHFHKGSTINLTCVVEFNIESPGFVFWYRDDESVSYDSPRGGISVITEKGETTTSFLLIQNADVSDAGNYSCCPSNADRASIVVHVLNDEAPAAMQSGRSANLISNNLKLIILTAVIIYVYPIIKESVQYLQGVVST